MPDCADPRRMADSTAFSFVSEQLEHLSQMTRAEARGTVRIALREAGLSASTVSVYELKVVLEKVMPRELAARRIREGEELCAQIAEALSGMRDDAPDGPEAVFGRIARS